MADRTFSERMRRRNIGNKFPDGIPYMTPEELKSFILNASNLELAKKYLRLEDAKYTTRSLTGISCAWGGIMREHISGTACIRRWKDRSRVNEQHESVEKEMIRRRLPVSLLKALESFINSGEEQERLEGFKTPGKSGLLLRPESLPA